MPRPTTRSKLRKAKAYATALVALAGGGALLGIPSHHVYQQQAQQDLQPPLSKIDNSDALTQQLAFFTLGGLRSLAAEIMTLEATDAWSKKDWPRALRRWEQATTLAPRRVNYWLHAAHDMAYNATAAVQSDPRLSPAEQNSEFDRYLKLGENFLLKGAACNPDSWQLRRTLADLYDSEYHKPNYRKAVKARKHALALGAPASQKRFLFYDICRTKGMEAEAWKLGRELFNDPEQHTPSLCSLLFVLQHRIQVPANEALSADAIYRPLAEQNYGRKLSQQEMQAFIASNLESMYNNNLNYPINGVRPYLKKYYLDLAHSCCHAAEAALGVALSAYTRARQLGATLQDTHVEACIQHFRATRSSVLPPTLRMQLQHPAP